MRFLVAAAGLLSIAGVANAQIPPTFKTVANADREKGKIALVDVVAKIVYVQVPRVIIKDGKEFTETVNEGRVVYEPRMVYHDAARSRVITPDGKQLPIDEVWKQLKPKMVVVVSADGKTPAPEYLRTLNAETLVLILPLAAPESIPLPKKD